LDTLDSYAEVSPSGTGLHIFVKAHLAHQGNRRGKVEIYDAGRYFTMTGCRWHDSPALISDRQEALESVHQKYIAPKPVSTPTTKPVATDLTIDDTDLINLAKSASNGAKFTQLWNGSAVGYESDSEADSALVCSLLFWCQGDTKRVDSLFRQSGRMRDKWDTRHARDGRTYGDITLENAAKTVTKYYTPKSIRIATPEEELPTVQVNPHEKRDRSTFCGLPSEAIAVYQHLQSGTASWLSDYVEFAKSASPMTPAAFHQAAALFAVSTIIARRLCLKVSTEEIFPNLFILFLARSTLYSKTTGFKIVETLFREAGLNHHLLPQRMTPEAMVQELSLNLPNGLNLSDTESRLSWLRERAFASQRGWMIDEAHSLLDGMKRDFNVGLMAMLLKMYDCPAHTVEQTVGRGRVTVKNGYLSFFGATTPASAADHLTNSLLWQNGIWARFAIITHDDEPTFQFFPSAMELPRHLINRLRDMAELFPTPRAELTDMEDIDGSKRKVVELFNVGTPASARLEDGVWQAWETYTRFIRYELLLTGQVDEDFYGVYGRMGTLVMKVAMILAVMDTDTLPVTITLAHYALAQSIVEDWRESLHRLRDHVLSTRLLQYCKTYFCSIAVNLSNTFLGYRAPLLLF